MKSVNSAIKPTVSRVELANRKYAGQLKSVPVNSDAAMVASTKAILNRQSAVKEAIKRTG